MNGIVSARTWAHALLCAGLVACARGAPPAISTTETAAPTGTASAERTAPSAIVDVAPLPAKTADAGASAREPEAGDAPRRGPEAARCGGDLPPVDLVRDNIATTVMSGLAEVVSSSKTGPGGKLPAPTTGYANLRYEVRVVRWLAGTGPEQLVLHQGVEAEARPVAPGTLLFFSACASADGSAHEPDVGYFFRVDPSCRAEAEALGDLAAKRARAQGKRRPRACERR